MNENEQLSQLKKIVGNFEETLQQIISIALSCPKGGDEKWNQVLEKYKVEPATPIQKETFYNNGVPVIKGVLPVELRKVFLSLRQVTIKNFRDTFQNQELSLDADMYWDDFTRRLQNFIEEELNVYLSKIKQPVGVSNIFANAFSGMNQFSQGLKGSDLNTKRCSSCGSPRSDENQYGECYFCGTPLFETPKVTAKCKICGAVKFIEDQDKPCQFCGN